jgi:uncharacterized membrane protein HdeD (DUF308 family)
MDLDIRVPIGLLFVAVGGLLALHGLLALLFGVSVAIWPGAGALALLALIATYAILTGLLLIGLGIRLRRMRQIFPQTQAA